MRSVRVSGLPLVVAAVAVLAVGCGGEAAPVEVSVADACSQEHHGHRVTVEGFLRLPSKLELSDTAVIEVFSLMQGDGDSVPLRLKIGDGPSELRDLPSTYTASSLRVGVENAKQTASIIDRVVVTAKVSDEDGVCVLTSPRIERAPEDG
mgnify:CR=1 FL=1